MVVNYGNTGKSKLLAGTLACGMHNIRDEKKYTVYRETFVPVFFGAPFYSRHSEFKTVSFLKYCVN